MPTIAFLGDIYGSPGRMVLQQQLPRIRADHSPDVVIANAENARSGSGLSPQIYHKLRAMGVDGITLGDHVFRDQRISSVLQTPSEPICRPANLPEKAIGRPYLRLEIGPEPASTIFVITVLGRIFFNMPADDPFATIDRILQGLGRSVGRGYPDAPRRTAVIVEAHMEATSEKAALGHYLDGRVTAVIGTHTHVPTTDARILPRGTGFITDVGMTGPYRSVIGANSDAVVKHMTTGMHVPFGVGSGDEAVCGVVIRVDGDTGLAKSIERIEYKADYSAPPFAPER